MIFKIAARFEWYRFFNMKLFNYSFVHGSMLALRC